MADDRVMVLTPPGVGAIAVVRLTGPGVGAFLDAHFSKGVPPAGRCVHGALRDAGGRVIDDPVVVAGEGAAWADLNVHGGAWVVRSVMELARRAGFAAIERGEPDAPLPPEVVDADVGPGAGEVEREVLQYLPLARTELALWTLLAQPAAWARVGAYDAGEVLADRALEHLLRPPRVAIVGLPNVGKSTLANRLFGRERSITADLPGTTRDWVGELADLDGLAVLLVDTPGVRETPDPIERAAIERAAGEVRAADLVLLVLDVTQPPGAGQQSLVDRYPSAIRVINKVDARAAWDPAGTDGILIAARTGQGVDPLRAAVRAHFGISDPFDPRRPRCWTDRQRDLLTRAG